MKFLSKLLSTIFYLGYFPYAPGTVGSVFGFVVFYIIRYTGIERIHLIIYALVLIIIGLVVSDYYEEIKGEKDPSEIIIDEFAAVFAMCVIVMPTSFLDYLILFGLFRIFDVWKPFPIKALEHLKGGFAILLDDFIAVAYSIILFVIINRII